MTEVEKQTLVRMLRQLTDVELAQVLQSRLYGAESAQDPNQERFFLGRVHRLGEVNNDIWELAAVAYTGTDKFGHEYGAMDVGFAEGGMCNTCGTACVSNEKHALYPVCGNKVYLT